MTSFLLILPIIIEEKGSTAEEFESKRLGRIRNRKMLEIFSEEWKLRAYYESYYGAVQGFLARHPLAADDRFSITFDVCVCWGRTRCLRSKGVARRNELGLSPQHPTPRWQHSQEACLRSTVSRGKGKVRSTFRPARGGICCSFSTFSSIGTTCLLKPTNWKRT